MRKIQSFVRRSGRLTTSQQHALNNLADDFIIHAITQDTFDNNNAVILEIGFGNGDSLLQMAQDEPEHNFIGIEVYEAGVGRLLNNANIHNLKNLKIINDDATEILQNTPDNYLSGLQLYFPDPWHKKKHNKRRIVTPEFLDLIALKMQKNGFVHMATDWQEYAIEMLEKLDNHQSFENSVSATQKFSDKPSRRPTTKFEKRGERLGHGVWDLIFIKK